MQGTVVARNRDSDTGQYIQAYSDSDLLDYLDTEGPTGTQAVADRFGYKQPTAYRRLRQLEQDGKVESEKVGNALLWSVVDEVSIDK
ncbi:winged helix-turn-helix domain-containing protein [Halohasta litorea]|uniref:Winged helix-turn-helix domain-containing protein n=1 Tax=Halohasta litorea TaxID=869891 RepID=A0ABD6D908_9EURY|nr:helix-turn-helix domain-containing protein [Halohasta litorea]